MSLEPGLLIAGDYRLVAPLGEGGMGSVWVAEQVSVSRQRALKVMRPEIVGDPVHRARFAREAHIGATISSEHVVQVVAAGVDEARGFPWIAMELLDGRDLASMISHVGSLPRGTVAEIGAQVAHAVAAAHAVGVIHRDLKPENIFVARSKRASGGEHDVKVLDFGIAKLAAEAAGTSSAPVGTPLYMAPEQTEPRAPVTAAIDVWAFGLILYRMLTGRHFWRAAREKPTSIQALMREILFDPIPLASARALEDGVGGRLPDGFDAWLQRCLERDPADRFTDVGEAYAAIRDRLHTDPSAVTMPTPSGFDRRSTPVPMITTPRTPAHSSVPPSSAELRLVDEHPDVKVGRASGLVVIRWRGTPTPSSVAFLDAALARAIPQHRTRPFAVMPVLDALTGQPQRDARERLAAVMTRYDDAIYAAAYVVLGTGFQAATVRGAITALMLMARPTHVTKVFATVADAIDWLATNRSAPSSDRFPKATLAGAVERFCAA
jgi:serine/threonine protein kinase